MKQNLNLLISFPLSFISSILFFKIYLFLSIDFEFIFEDFESITFFFNPNSAIEKKEYFSILISNCVAVEKNKR